MEKLGVVNLTEKNKKTGRERYQDYFQISERAIT